MLIESGPDSAGTVIVRVRGVVFMLGPGESTLLAGLVGYWRFEDGSGAVASDDSGNGNDGTLLNMGPSACTLSGRGLGISPTPLGRAGGKKDRSFHG